MPLGLVLHSTDKLTAERVDFLTSETVRLPSARSEAPRIAYCRAVSKSPKK